MLLQDIDAGPMHEAFTTLLPIGMLSTYARIQMLAIGLQESGLRERVQRAGGPARGLWQFERGGGVAGVLRHPSTDFQAQMVCRARGVEPSAQPVWEALATDDVLAAAFARLLLWTDPHKMPKDAAGGWQLYLRTWRPGKPHPGTWAGYYARAERWVLDGQDS